MVLPKSPAPMPLEPRKTWNVWFGAACLLASGCATTSGSTDVRDEVVALRQTHEADQKRIKSLEAEVESLQLQARSSPPSEDEREPPTDLQIIHLEKPSPNPPPLATAVPVREPSLEELAALSHPSPSETADAARPTSPEEADVLFSLAFEKLKTGELVRAANEFQEFARRFPRNPAADNALLDEGIAFYGLKQYQEALVTFRGLIKRYPAGDAVPEAMYREAECAEKLGHPDEARTLLRHVRTSYPQSAEAVRADRRLTELAANEGENR